MWQRSYGRVICTASFLRAIQDITLARLNEEAEQPRAEHASSTSNGCSFTLFLQSPLAVWLEIQCNL